MKLTDIHRILSGRETRIALLSVFRNGSRPHRVHDRSRTSHLSVTKWLNGLLELHQSTPLPSSPVVFDLLMISRAGVSETFGAIGKVGKEVEKPIRDRLKKR